MLETRRLGTPIGLCYFSQKPCMIIISKTRFLPFISIQRHVCSWIFTLQLGCSWIFTSLKHVYKRVVYWLVTSKTYLLTHFHLRDMFFSKFQWLRTHSPGWFILLFVLACPTQLPCKSKIVWILCFLSSCILKNHYFDINMKYAFIYSSNNCVVSQKARFIRCNLIKKWRRMRFIYEFWLANIHFISIVFTPPHIRCSIPLVLTHKSYQTIGYYTQKGKRKIRRCQRLVGTHPLRYCGMF